MENARAEAAGRGFVPRRAVRRMGPYWHFGKPGTSVQPLDQRHLVFRLLAKRDGETDLRDVVSLYG